MLDPLFARMTIRASILLINIYASPYQIIGSLVLNFTYTG